MWKDGGEGVPPPCPELLKPPVALRSLPFSHQGMILWTRSTWRFSSIDTMVDQDQVVQFPAEFLNSLQPPGMPPHNLVLKRGSPMMLLRNLDPTSLCNGTRLIVKSMRPPCDWGHHPHRKFPGGGCLHLSHPSHPLRPAFRFQETAIPCSS